MRMSCSDRIQVGEKFERLTVTGESYMRDCGERRRRVFPCRCDCGNQLAVYPRHLISGNTGSCGCLQRDRIIAAVTKHGAKHSRLYNVWCAMKARCENTGNKRHRHYGGRGIQVCDQWVSDFAVFQEWATTNGYREGEGLSIERVNVDGNYEPSNCTWIPLKDQALNRTSRHNVTAFGETKSLQEWTKDPRCAVQRLSLYGRLKAGWNPETAIVTPPQKKDEPNGFIRVETKERPNTRYITAFGETKSLVLWSLDPRAKVSSGTIRSRVVSGWDTEIAITTPPQAGPRTENYIIMPRK